jgi:hypothetical protein
MTEHNEHTFVTDLKPMPPVWLDKLQAVAREYDDDCIAILVMHGSPDRGLALSVWTQFEEDEDPMPRTVALLNHALNDHIFDQDVIPKQSGQSDA